MNQEGIEVHQTDIAFVWIFLPKRTQIKISFLSFYHSGTAIAREKTLLQPLLKTAPLVAALGCFALSHNCEHSTLLTFILHMHKTKLITHEDLDLHLFESNLINFPTNKFPIMQFLHIG